MFGSLRSTCPRLARCLLSVAIALLLFALLGEERAEAYPWMIKHDHPGCVQCHMDPSGAGLLTAYGREEGEATLPMSYGAPPSDETQAQRARFAWGLFDMPGWLLLGAGLRSGIIVRKVDGASAKPDLALMQADARVGVRAGGFRVSATLGFVNDDSSPASVAGSLVSREHWLGYAWRSDALIVRAGRLNVPFGLRVIEHDFLVRRLTRTDINDSQQHGVALAFAGRWLRGEVMGILGNYQLRTAANRDRGYSGYLELMPTTWAAVGVSSLVTHAERDILWGVDDTRQAHGVFARVAPAEALALLGEIDYLHDRPGGGPSTHAWVGLLQADVEPRQGLHLIGAGEGMTSGYLGSQASVAGWLGVDWFFWSHLDVRADVVRLALSQGPSRQDQTVFVLQAHGYL